MTRKLYALLLRAYPYEYRGQFEREMIGVFDEASGERSAVSEITSLLRGIVREWYSLFERSGKIVPALSALSGAVLAIGIHSLFYAVLVPIAHAQSVKEPGPLEIVTSLYRRTFGALHDAKTKEDIARMVNNLDTPDWVSIDPHGVTVLTHDEEIRQLEDFLNVPPERRPSNTIEVLWVHEEPWKIVAVDLVHSGVQGSAAMPPFRSKGTFGQNAESRFTLAGSLVRDTFARTPEGWRRIRHEKLLPDQFAQIQGDSVVSDTAAR